MALIVLNAVVDKEIAVPADDIIACKLASTGITSVYLGRKGARELKDMVAVQETPQEVVEKISAIKGVRATGFISLTGEFNEANSTMIKAEAISLCAQTFGNKTVTKIFLKNVAGRQMGGSLTVEESPTEIAKKSNALTR